MNTEDICHECGGEGYITRERRTPGLEHSPSHLVSEVCQECGGLGHPNDAYRCDNCGCALGVGNGFNETADGYTCTSCYSSAIDYAYESYKDSFFD